MTFMYLMLKNTENGIAVTVVNDGVVPSSLGSANSRWSVGRPFAIYAIDSFDGLEAISTKDLLVEIQQRLSPQELRNRLKWEITTEELLEMLRERLGS